MGRRQQVQPLSPHDLGLTEGQWLSWAEQRLAQRGNSFATVTTVTGAAYAAHPGLRSATIPPAAQSELRTLLAHAESAADVGAGRPDVRSHDTWAAVAAKLAGPPEVIVHAGEGRLAVTVDGVLRHLRDENRAAEALLLNVLRSDSIAARALAALTHHQPLQG